MKMTFFNALGTAGVIGLGLLLFSLSFGLGNVLPAHAELARLSSERDTLAAQARAHSVASTAPRGTAQAPLPALKEMPELLKQLGALATRHGVVVERSAYQLRERGGMRRLEISMPLKVRYPALRAYLRDALALTPTAALDELALQRGQASEATLDAQVRLSYAFASAP